MTNPPSPSDMRKAKEAKKAAFKAYQEEHTLYLKGAFGGYTIFPTPPKAIRGSTCIGYTIQHNATGYEWYVADRVKAFKGLNRMAPLAEKHLQWKEAHNGHPC